ncbi:MAG: NADH-quinone oxidoreductase subunit NuoK [Bacteroidia bacterium]|nr:NADH-quinone oxidoreductase subunit NuoK [Bacteroidia bacterium]
MVPVQHLLVLGAVLLTIGLMIVIIKRNAIMVLMGIELMFNAANINLVAFNQLYSDNFNGQLFALFVILVAVCEAAVGLAIVFSVYKYYHTSVPEEVNELKES